jgi:hypothetical protein
VFVGVVAVLVQSVPSLAARCVRRRQRVVRVRPARVAARTRSRLTTALRARRDRRAAAPFGALLLLSPCVRRPLCVVRGSQCVTLPCCAVSCSGAGRGARGGRGRGRGDGAPFRGREFDRHSGTGRGREVAKNGAGKFNWDTYVGVPRPVCCALCSVQCFRLGSCGRVPV